MVPGDPPMRDGDLSDRQAEAGGTEPERTMGSGITEVLLLAGVLPRASASKRPRAPASPLSPGDALALAADADGVVGGPGDDVGERVADMLSTLTPLDRTWTLLYWTLSARLQLRLAVARAAQYLPSCVGLRSALARLAGDHRGEVRQAAYAAMACRADLAIGEDPLPGRPDASPHAGALQGR